MSRKLKKSEMARMSQEELCMHAEDNVIDTKDELNRALKLGFIGLAIGAIIGFTGGSESAGGVGGVGLAILYGLMGFCVPFGWATSGLLLGGLIVPITVLPVVWIIRFALAVFIGPFGLLYQWLRYANAKRELSTARRALDNSTTSEK